MERWGDMLPYYAYGVRYLLLFRYPGEIYVVLRLSEAIQGRHILAASRIMNVIPSVIVSNLTRISASASQNQQQSLPLIACA